MGNKSGGWQEHDWAGSEALTLLELRDLVVECMVGAHGLQFGTTRAALGLDDGEHAVRESVQGIVRLAFQTVGGSYDAPTLPVLAKVVNFLAERSIGWGAPADDIFDCHSTITRHLGRTGLAQDADRNSPDN